MKCPECNATKSVVRETRQKEDGIYRYRECMGCGRSFKTKEEIFVGVINRNRTTGQPTGPSSEQPASPWKY